MFDRMLANSHPAHALEQIEKIQKDFLELIGPGAPHMTEKRIDDTMEKAISVNPPGAKRVFEHLRLTPYQDPIYQRELSVCARFVVDSFNYYVPPDGISIATEDMDMIPFSSIHSVALNGLIKHFEYLEGVPIKVPYIFIFLSIRRRLPGFAALFAAYFKKVSLRVTGRKTSEPRRLT
ncbi:MAG: hypothetical protein H6844_19270 [Alphaproteobacteria bacterium]|nr:hypothetical protein [Alphaproteobacteria bacterium]